MSSCSSSFLTLLQYTYYRQNWPPHHRCLAAFSQKLIILGCVQLLNPASESEAIGLRAWQAALHVEYCCLLNTISTTNVRLIGEWEETWQPKQEYSPEQARQLMVGSRLLSIAIFLTLKGCRLLVLPIHVATCLSLLCLHIVFSQSASPCKHGLGCVR